MIFLTVGTQFAFDRLVKAVDEAMGQKVIEEEIFAQIGESSYIPANFRYAKTMDKSEYDRHVLSSTAIIGHAGMGTIISAMNAGKPLLVLPRMRKFKEAVNDHQVSIARQFEHQRYLLAAYKAEEIAARMKELSSFVPARRKITENTIVERISRFLSEISH